MVGRKHPGFLLPKPGTPNKISEAINERGGFPVNLYYMRFPRSGKVEVIKGDVAFMQWVIWIGDKSIHSVENEPDPVLTVMEGETVSTKLDAIRDDGQITWIEFKRAKDASRERTGRAKNQLSAQGQAASAAGVHYEIITERELIGKEVLFCNWLCLAGCINRTYQYSLSSQFQLLLRITDRYGSVSLGQILGHAGVDVGIMWGVVAERLQSGWLNAPLDTELICLDTMVSRLDLGRPR